MRHIWGVPCEELDRIVIARLCDLAQYDSDMSGRIKAQWEQRKSSEVNDVRLLNEQIKQTEAQLRHLDKLLTDPVVP